MKGKSEKEDFMAPNAVQSSANVKIDRASFILGMITAFAECIANEAKKLAFSPPMYAEDYADVKEEAEAIASDLSVHMWLERNEDLALEKPLFWLVIYKFPEVLEAYQRLRGRSLNPALHFEYFFDLLSYGSVWGKGADSVSNQLRETRPQQDVFARILLDTEDWPISAPI